MKCEIHLIFSHLYSLWEFLTQFSYGNHFSLSCSHQHFEVHLRRNQLQHQTCYNVKFSKHNYTSSSGSGHGMLEYILSSLLQEQDETQKRNMYTYNEPTECVARIWDYVREGARVQSLKSYITAVNSKNVHKCIPFSLANV